MVYRLVNSTYNVQELVLRLTRLLCQFIKADSSSIYLLDRKTHKVQLKAIFDNKINILLTKKKDLGKLSAVEKRVLQGNAVVEKHLIGIPLVADDSVGAIFVKRKRSDEAFTEYDKEILSVVVEQSVTAIRNLQLNEEQQQVILGSIEFIGKLLDRQGYRTAHTPDFFKIVKTLSETLNLHEDEIESLQYACILRDVGVIDVPFNILAKTSQLTAEEFKEIRQQPARSVELIKPVAFLKPVLPVILYHHERYDGTGYPSGLKKEQIPIGARVMAVVDAFEAMTRERPYRQRLSVKEALNEIKASSGSQFDPVVVQAFIELTKQKKFKKYLSVTHK
ncbi:MAG: HD-GYP domain-containing protein (c-di-GMP phosphodiesterase class II) [Lysobacterales bacterium]|jgi:HD-GYP domain-containing protein (c-di-GMP phosphodiesterase class II)